MPIPTDEDAWKDGFEPTNIKEEIQEFLKSHSEQAFEVREISDEVTNTEFKNEEHPLGVNPTGLTTEQVREDQIASALIHAVRLSLVKNRLRELSQEGEVDCRRVDITDYPEFPDEVEERIFYSSN